MLDLRNLTDRLLVFGGPYSNLAATMAMRERATELGIGPDCVICSGDVVAYCAEPAETVELIRDWGIHVVMGNCEESLGFSEPDCGCGFAEGSSCSTLAVAWYRYADQRIDGGQREWMRNLPRAIDFTLADLRFRCVHGSLDSINQFVFASSPDDTRQEQMKQAGIDVVVGGHSGIPFGRAIGDGYWLNAGVIGMPANDGTPDGWYMLLEPGADGLQVSWHRLEYDHEIASRSTIAAGMPEYGRALADGLWPGEDILPSSERAQRGQRIDLGPIAVLADSQIRRGADRPAAAGLARD